MTRAFWAKPVELPDTFPADVFWSRVHKGPWCWTWTGPSRVNGYARIQHRREDYFVHRVAWLLTHGSIDPRLTIDHLCRNRLCVNPAHLEQVTGRENSLRSTSPTAVNAIKTHCKRGHPLAGENLYLRARSRICRTCQRASSAAYRDRCRAIRAAVRGD